MMFGLYSDFLIISSILYSPLGEMVLVARERERERCGRVCMSWEEFDFCECFVAFCIRTYVCFLAMYIAG